MSNIPTILNGAEVSKIHEQVLLEKVSKLSVKPHLVIIQIGNNPASSKYVEFKKRFANRIGAVATHVLYEEIISENELIEKIKSYNNDNSVHGIIVQLPIPKHIRPWIILDAIDSKKDVDGLCSLNIHHVYENDEIILPATTKGILTLLSHYNISFEGKHVVIVGHSSLVGKPTALMALNRNATVTVCHKYTKNLASVTKMADILIVAVGKADLINEAHIKEGCVIVDVGINVTAENKVVGDVSVSSVSEKASAISPVPGGVGPMTIVSLFENLLQLYERQIADFRD